MPGSFYHAPVPEISMLCLSPVTHSLLQTIPIHPKLSSTPPTVCLKQAGASKVISAAYAIEHTRTRWCNKNTMPLVHCRHCYLRNKKIVTIYWGMGRPRAGRTIVAKQSPEPSVQLFNLLLIKEKTQSKNDATKAWLVLLTGIQLLS